MSGCIDVNARGEGRELADSFYEEAMHSFVTGRHDDAEQAFRMAVALRPQSAEFRLELACSILTNPKQLTPERQWAARRHLARAWVDLPESAQTHYSLALYFRRTGDWKSYRLELEEALSYDPNHEKANEELVEVKQARMRQLLAERAHMRSLGNNGTLRLLVRKD